MAGDVNRRLDFAIWTAVYFVSLPVLPYLKLLYAESLLLLMLSIVLFYCSQKEMSTSEKYIVLACVILLPFIHIRASLVAAVFGIYIFYRTWSEGHKISTLLITMTIAVVVALPIFA